MWTPVAGIISLVDDVKEQIILFNVCAVLESGCLRELISYRKFRKK